MRLNRNESGEVVIGMLSYVLVKLLAGKFRDLSPVTMVLALLFIAKLVFW